MAIEVEDGTGKADAVSYASVADADSYFAARGSAKWAALSNERKEQGLIRATDFLSEQYDGKWKGTQTSVTQALAWPRTSVVFDTLGMTLEPDEMPSRLVRATIELALLASGGDLYALGGGGGTDTARVAEREVKIGPITEREKYAVDAGTVADFSKPVIVGDRITNLILPLLGANAVGGGFRIELVRV